MGRTGRLLNFIEISGIFRSVRQDFFLFASFDCDCIRGFEGGFYGEYSRKIRKKDEPGLFKDTYPNYMVLNRQHI